MSITPIIRKLHPIFGLVAAGVLFYYQSIGADPLAKSIFIILFRVTVLLGLLLLYLYYIKPRLGK